MITDDDLNKALDRIAHTADGELLYLYFQKVLCEIPVIPATPGARGALQAHHGRRSLAAELMGKMAQGIEQSAGSQQSGDGQRFGRPVVFSGQQPAEGGGRYRNPRQFLAGQSEPATAEPKSGRR